jgi:hypothetical protein
MQIGHEFDGTETKTIMANLLLSVGQVTHLILLHNRSIVQ